MSLGTSSRRRVGGHTSWCARDHRCNLGEHRSDPLTLTAPGGGAVVLTRVAAVDGREHVEIRTRIVLAPGEEEARADVARIITALDALVRHLTRLPR